MDVEIIITLTSKHTTVLTLERLEHVIYSGCKISVTINRPTNGLTIYLFACDSCQQGLLFLAFPKPVRSVVLSYGYS